MALSYIFLPGMHGTDDLFEPLFRIMPQEIPRRAIAYPTDQPLAYPALLRLIEAQTRAETDIVMVGESFSGALALRFAAAHPGRVRAVVLIAGFISPSVPRLLCYLGAPLALLPIPLPGLAIRCFLSGFSAATETVRAMRRAVWRNQTRVIAHRILQVSTLNARDALRNCRAPILYLAGSRDRLVGTRAARTIRRLRPDITLHTLNAPHVLLQTKPSECWQLIHQFLNDKVFAAHSA